MDLLLIREMASAS